MINFVYEEQEEKRFLVYEKKTEDIVDTMSLGMISNNKIEGVVPVIYVQVDGSVYMKYNISGKVSLQECFSGTVNKQKLLDILSKFADVIIRAEEYMLESSAFVLDPSYIYMEPGTNQIELVVLPIEREEMPLAVFLRQLIFSAQYDQNENCSYIAALISFFNSSQMFSIHEFKKFIQHLQAETLMAEQKQGAQYISKNVSAGVEPQNRQKNPAPQEKLPWQDVHISHEQTINNSQSSQRAGTQNHYQQQASPRQPQYQQQPQQYQQSSQQYQQQPQQYQQSSQQYYQQPQEINTVAEESGEVPKEKKKGLFKKKDKKEKPPKKEKPAKEKKGLFGRKADKGVNKDNRFGNIAIPGEENGRNSPNRGQQGEYERQEYTIPEQQLKMEQHQVPHQDFGDTVDLQTYKYNDDTTLLNQGQEGPQIRPRLYRISTGEVYRITKTVTKVGRKQDAVDICIVGNDVIGRIHAIIYMQSGRVTLEDNASRNGTYVDGVKLEKGDVPVSLNHGAIIRLANEEFEFRMYE